MRLTFFVLLLFSSFVALSQNKYMTRNGQIHFFSEAPLENIEASNNQVNSVFDISTGEIAFSVLMRGFEFEKALMQEHFNENYVESDKYPRANFKGKIKDFDQLSLEGGEKTVTVTGDLTIHGVTRNITVEGKMQKSGHNIRASTTFPVKLDDYKIKVPKVVRNNIAEVVEVKVEINLEPMNDAKL